MTESVFVVTHSDISMFLSCRRKFDWNYLMGYRAEEKLWGPLACGRRVHESLEMFHRRGDLPVAAHQALAERDEAEMIRAGAASWAMDEFYADVVMGRNCCAAYLEWVEREGPYTGYRVYPEVVMEAPIMEGRVLLRGKADLLLERESDGWLFVNDFKTASPHTRTSLPVQLEKSYQHFVYMALAHLTRPGQHVGGAAYTVLYKLKDPRKALHPMVERLPAHGTSLSAPHKLKQLEKICEDILRLAEQRDVEGSMVAYPTPQDSCRWCEYRSPCDITDDSPLGARAMLDDTYARVGRHARYR